MPILLQCIHLKKRLIPFFFALVLAGCANIFSNSFTNTLKNDANANSDFYINRIAQAKSVEDQQTYKLLAARVLVTENKVASAEAFLAELKDLTEAQLLDKSIVDAHVSAAKKNNQLAKSQLAAINLALLSPSQKARYYEVVARIAENQNDTIEAVKARIQIDNFLTDTQRKQENNDRTWALLRNTNRGVINNTVVEGSPALAGWIALAKAYNDNINNAAQLSQALQNWRLSYPSHSATYLFPTELRGLFNFQGTNLSQIALLLPLSDNAQLIGNTIKKGFDDARGDSAIQVTVFDTMTQSIESIIEQAKQQGITTLVGPLLKQNVDTLLNNPAHIQGLNVLALNSTPNARAIGQLCYYGLSPEDEAESAANKMWNDGIRNPLVLVPQADVGQRTASAFNVRWQQLAATDANIRFYNNPDDINFALQGGLSQNAEALYIVATSEQLAEIKTSVDNTNRNLKLYASSRSNSPNNGPEYRLLMNGLQFSDIPFFKETSSAQYRQIEQMTNGDYSLMRLYAMGADAWLLINQFNELRQVPGFSINGLTGKLSAGPNCNVERDMTWFVYQNAEVVAIN
ncbi:MAG: penicillin-binding protein activator [[Pasteurella] mairii]|uniref:Penicillin-binding protein activator LpoA n=1 Tax=[Pasteurella] mairii TaxID=757 RepID=A0A379B3G0_9PAST|nr:penicillin-binding protein activator [[Pasteurella] mairii]SUB33046.1 LppC [[Pasteurella] mairii]